MTSIATSRPSGFWVQGSPISSPCLAGNRFATRWLCLLELLAFLSVWPVDWRASVDPKPFICLTVDCESLMMTRTLSTAVALAMILVVAPFKQPMLR